MPVGFVYRSVLILPLSLVTWTSRNGILVVDVVCSNCSNAWSKNVTLIKELGRFFFTMGPYEENIIYISKPNYDINDIYIYTYDKL